MKAISSLQAVFFDAGGTILNVRAPVGESYAEAVGRRGHPVDARKVEQAFHSAWKRSLERRQAANFVSNDDLLRDEWRKIVLDSLGGLVPPKIVSQAFEELYELFSGPDPWLVAEGVRETFGALKSEGIAVGLLSNWDRRLPGCLEKLGLGGCFDHQVISFEVGVEKPHPRIFQVAAKQAGCSPERLLMVGDSYEQDIAPARELGWHAIWLTGKKENMEDSVDTVESFGQVLRQIRRILVESGE